MPTVFLPFVSPSERRPTLSELVEAWPMKAEPVCFFDVDFEPMDPNVELLSIGFFNIVRPDGPRSDCIEVKLNVVRSVDDIWDDWCQGDEWPIPHPELIRVSGTVGFFTGCDISDLDELVLAILGSLFPGAIEMDLAGECHPLDGKLKAVIDSYAARGATVPPGKEATHDAADRPRKSFWSRLFGRS